MFLDFWVSWVFMGVYGGLWVSGYLRELIGGRSVYGYYI